MSVDKRCPDCEGLMREIRLIDKGHAELHKSMEYAAADSEKGRWTGRYPIEGRIHGFMCQECGTIRLYGEPAA